VYRHRICDRLLLLHLRLFRTIIPLANVWRQVVIIDVVAVVVVVVVDVAVIRHRSVAVVTIVVNVVIVVRRAIAVKSFLL
jgi:hypothetical protein